MTNHRRPWRLASLLSVALVVGVASVGQAGVIPWVYDAIFGPVRYPVRGNTAYGYGGSPYYVSYGRPVYMPVAYGAASGCGVSRCSPSVIYSAPGTACGPCGGWSPVAYAPSNGSCSVASYSSSGSGNCLSGCAPASDVVPAKAESTNGEKFWKKSETDSTSTPGAPPRETFAPEDTPNSINDGLGAGGRSRGTRPADEKPRTTDAFKPTTDETESIIPKSQKKPADDSLNELFEKPLDSTKDNVPNGDKTDSTLRLPLPTHDLDSQFAWRVEPQRTRMPFYAQVANVTVARRVPSVDSDWTLVRSRERGPQLAKR